MTETAKISTSDAVGASRYGPLAKACFERLTPLMNDIGDLRKALDDLADIGDPTTQQSVDGLRQRLAELEPTITMIGQVKAGKTSLVNALVGAPDLLPADVNPWTSVVTSLHLNPSERVGETKARFQFFNRNEWEKLVVNGGRMGELAGRAGAENEVEKVHRQIAEMQEKSRQRLGRKFELLLGQTHDYGYFDSQLIERYVCLGDDFEDDHETSKTQGRFADITRSAELFLHRPDVPIPLCIRDTPGVNDTFMVREQITIRAVRESRTCVVVLSAHQALSSVDMALIRLISNVKSREVIIFVNRIDELSDPAVQVPEIHDSIQRTLRDHQGPEGVQVLFGSAYWANKALTGAEDMDMDSAAALENWAAAVKPGQAVSVETPELLWLLSGVPALFAALSERIVEGPGREAVDGIARSARNLCGGLRASNNIVNMRREDGPKPQIDREQIEAWIQELNTLGTRVVNSKFAKIVEDFDTRVDRANESFLQRATAALIDHLERHGDSKVWKYDPTGLRVLMRSAYQLFAKRAQATVKEILDATAGEVTDLYRELKLIDDPDFAIEPPGLPRVPPPVLLGQTIALDMQANWWTRWWRRRRGYEAFAEEFYKLIQAETQPIADGLKLDHARAVTAAALQTFTDFVAEQAQILRTLAEQDSLCDEDIAAVFGTRSEQDRQAALESALKTLEKLAA